MPIIEEINKINHYLPLPSNSKCEKCGSTSRLHRHHITYDPPKYAILCHLCHRKVTGLNARCGSLQRRKLTNEQRMFLTQFFLSPYYTGKLSRGTARNLINEVTRILDERTVPTGLGDAVHSDQNQGILVNNLNHVPVDFGTKLGPPSTSTNINDRKY